MRNITQRAASVFTYGPTGAKLGNTEIKYTPTHARMYLHGNLIAERNRQTGDLRITNAGWQSNVTKERLNGISGVNVYQKNFTWYLNGQEWNGEWINPVTMKQEEQTESSDLLRMTSMVATFGNLLCNSDNEKIEWKKRFLAINPGITFPDDFDSLPDEEKQRRLNEAIKIGLENR
jgi:hypothetical protein